MTVKINYPNKSTAPSIGSILTKLRARQKTTNANKITMPTGLTNGSLVTGLPAGQIFTLSGMATAGAGSTITVTGMDMASTSKEPFMTKHEYIVIKTDLLAMSCARHRMMENVGLLNEELAEKVTAEDHEMASKIRRYYSDKCIVWKLKDKELSDFRRDMYTFLNTDGTKFEEKMVSLAYRMPTFYAYDIEFDEIRQGRNVDFKAEDFNDQLMHQHSPSIRKLTPIKMLYRRTKNRNQNEYWFHDEDNHLVVIEINPTNSLLPIWKNLYERESIKIYGYYWLKLRNDTPCFAPQRWELMENRKESST